MADERKKVSLGQAGAGEDHAAKILREKIGDVRELARVGEGGRTVIEGMVGADQRGVVEKIIEGLRGIYDPEIPVNIFDLGLIYKLVISPENAVKVEMTLTAPGCPVAGEIVAGVKRVVEAVPEVAKAEVELVWEPVWTRERLSEEARLELGM